MPRKKTLVVIIICFALVLSIWLISKKPENLSLSGKNENTVVAGNYIEINEKTNDDWKKLLTTVDDKTSIIDLTKSESNISEDTTLTAQMSRDFMSQYLLLKRGGGELTAEQMSQIGKNVLSLPEYNINSAVVYVNSNLNIINANDTPTLKKYRDTVNSILKKRSMQVAEGPISIVSTAVTSKDSKVLERLDSVIAAAKGTLNDLLSISVPSSAVKVHLGLINAISAVLSSLESMRLAFTDPVKASVGISHYSQSMINFQNALSAINSFFVSKLGSSI